MSIIILNKIILLNYFLELIFYYYVFYNKIGQATLKYIVN